MHYIVTVAFTRHMYIVTDKQNERVNDGKINMSWTYQNEREMRPKPIHLA